MSNLTRSMAVKPQGDLEARSADTPDSLPSLDSLGPPGASPRLQTLPSLDSQGEERTKTPISNDPRHPVQSHEVSAYFSRTGNLDGRDTAAQAEAIASAMLSLRSKPGEPRNVLLLEASGPAGGSYVDELRKSLPIALSMVPEHQRPELRLFISDGRPVLPARGEEQSRNEFANYLIELNKPPNQGRGLVDRDMSIPNVDRAVPNWGNPAVTDYFIRERVEPAIQLARQFGIEQIIVDDHIGIPKDTDANPPVRSMTYFRRLNGENGKPLSQAGANDLVTGAYEQVLEKIKSSGLKTGLSSVAEPQSALAFGIDIDRLAKKTDAIEIQAYRSDAQAVRRITENLYQSIASHFEQYRDVSEFKFALVTRANKRDLTETTLIGQQEAIEAFERRVQRLYNKHGEDPPKTTTSLWAHQNFYK